MEFVEFLIKNGNFEKLMAFVELMCVHLDEGEFLRFLSLFDDGKKKTDCLKVSMLSLEFQCEISKRLIEFFIKVFGILQCGNFEISQSLFEYFVNVCEKEY